MPRLILLNGARPARTADDARTATFTTLFDMQIRPATATDAAGIARVHVQAWRETYRGIMPDRVLDGLDEEARARGWAGLIAAPRPEVWVAERDGGIVGWATSSPGRDANGPHPLELEGIYTLREVHGAGVGRRLLEAAIGVTEGAYLWLLEANARARAFYERNGFVWDGSRKLIDFDPEKVPEIRMVRAPRSSDERSDAPSVGFR